MGLTFSSFSQNSSSPNLILGVSSIDALGFDLVGSELSTEVQVILKKLAKRNSTTKLKALDELLAHLKASEMEELSQFLPAWVISLFDYLIMLV
ncbi:listerin E3 ubiquitin protein ligase 1 [Entomophthora muscae]|uniref:Listerin E3 ubiquitin protein ligase 1 n=1 Tax=Entomophthora muscae TaxID=34485 RepID=A0ACC2RPX6_9FUNG|nr:listerin E3 ubiquitin protein ligase 1 [Entomophthora muscae]